ncbi:15008_t:CDS:2 [Acaulospora colombiana]|uniref:15008_t:CDS:1 n=1 Tax=Acaulospora colombiana TaxID=27376 RepID=A0ACA9K3X2_9GLOM|nr:15008_t:CDS:2 [Acaulospora colombiana]
MMVESDEILNSDLDSIKYTEFKNSTKVVFLNNGRIFLLDPRIFSITTGYSSGYYNLLGESIAFIDPNVLKDPRVDYTTEFDIYSFGVIMWEISNRSVPVFNVKSYELLPEGNIENNIQEESKLSTPQEYVDLYRRCWLEPEKRPIILDIYKELEEMNKMLGEKVNFIYKFYQTENAFLTNTTRP